MERRRYKARTCDVSACIGKTSTNYRETNTFLILIDTRPWSSTMDIGGHAPDLLPDDFFLLLALQFRVSQEAATILVETGCLYEPFFTQSSLKERAYESELRTLR
jgi:hypothetical protein